MMRMEKFSGIPSRCSETTATWQSLRLGVCRWVGSRHLSFLGPKRDEFGHDCALGLFTDGHLPRGNNVTVSFYGRPRKDAGEHQGANQILILHVGWSVRSIEVIVGEADEVKKSYKLLTGVAVKVPVVCGAVASEFSRFAKI
jgi:hypothetical protein